MKTNITTNKICHAIAGCLVAIFATSASADPAVEDVLNYSTLGVWAGAPLGVSGRLGLAIPLNKKLALTAGAEVGLKGTKQFVGWRSFSAGHGVWWGGVDFAHWKTQSNPLLADADTNYYGVEVEVLIARAGVMVPSGGNGSTRLTLGVGLGF